MRNEFLSVAKEQGIIKSAPQTAISKGLKVAPGDYGIDRFSNFNVTTDVKVTDIKAINELQVPLKNAFPSLGSKAPGNIIFHRVLFVIM